MTGIISNHIFFINYQSINQSIKTSMQKQVHVLYTYFKQTAENSNKHNDIHAKHINSAKQQPNNTHSLCLSLELEYRQTNNKNKADCIISLILRFIQFQFTHLLYAGPSCKQPFCKYAGQSCKQPFITDQYRTVLYNKYRCGYLQDDTIPDPIPVYDFSVCI